MSIDILIDLIFKTSFVWQKKIRNTQQIPGPRLNSLWHQLKWEDTELFFQEVTGLSAETQIIEYRHGNSPGHATVKMPGLQKFGNVTMKKGVLKGDAELWKEYQQLNRRTNITINLLDEAHNVVMSWELSNAFPAKITTTDLKADGNEVAVETMELAHEGLKLVKG